MEVAPPPQTDDDHISVFSDLVGANHDPDGDDEDEDNDNNPGARSKKLADLLQASTVSELSDYYRDTKKQEKDKYQSYVDKG